MSAVPSVAMWAATMVAQLAVRLDTRMVEKMAVSMVGRMAVQLGVRSVDLTDAETVVQLVDY